MEKGKFGDTKGWSEAVKGQTIQWQKTEKKDKQRSTKNKQKM
jgi:hypothetical protein